MSANTKQAAHQPAPVNPPTRRGAGGKGETALVRAIMRALEKLGYWPIRIQSGVIPALYGSTKRFIHCAEPGCPDIYVADVGLWLEVKTAAGRLNPMQVAWHVKAAKRGVKVAVVRTVAEALATVAGDVVPQELGEKPAKLPAPIVITSAKQLSDLMGWKITDEDFEQRFPSTTPVWVLPEGTI